MYPFASRQVLDLGIGLPLVFFKGQGKRGDAGLNAAARGGGDGSGPGRIGSLACGATTPGWRKSKQGEGNNR